MEKHLNTHAAGEPDGRRSRFRSLAASLIAAAAIAASALEPTMAKPNIIFILADDLGYGDTGFSWQMRRNPDSPRLHTPHLDALAGEGAVLTSHYCAAPVCAPSRATIITGRMQGNCSLRDNCFDRAFSETRTIGTVLHDAGYETWAVGKWGVAGGGESGEKVSSHPLDRGFDYFYGFLDHMAGHTYYHYEGYVRNAFMGITENRTNATQSAEGVYSTDLFAAKAKELISAHLAKSPEKPFFMYLAMNTIHGSGYSAGTPANKDALHVPGGPYPANGVSWPVPKEPVEKRNTWIDPKYSSLPPAAARYATAISRLDDAIGDVARHLEKCGIDKDTLLIFTSDNGPADEYGADPRFFCSPGPFDGLKRDVFEGGMRVPAFARWPGRIAPGTTDNLPSQSQDWIATFADAASESPVDRLEDGVSLLPRWGARKTQGGAIPESTVYTQYEFPWDGYTQAYAEFKSRKGDVRGLQQMVRLGDFVALRTRIREKGLRTRLFNVTADPFQTEDLAGKPEYDEKLKSMEAILDEKLKK